MVERKQGERFFVGQTQLKVVLDEPNTGCTHCYFWRKNDMKSVLCPKPLDVVGYCAYGLRSDKANVHFEEV